jgi:hypothetical protein
LAQIDADWEDGLTQRRNARQKKVGRWFQVGVEARADLDEGYRDRREYFRARCALGASLVRILLLFALFFVSAVLFGVDKITTRAGVLSVEGFPLNSQVYLTGAQGRVGITHFARWELVEYISVSPDEKLLAVYHRPDKAKAFSLDIYRLSDSTRVATVKPGYSCINILWTDDKLIFHSGMTGTGDIYRFYRLKDLGYLYEIVGLGQYFDLESGRTIVQPIYSGSDGTYEVYDTQNGARVETFDFKNEIGGIYTANDIQKLGTRKYRFQVETNPGQVKNFVREIK